MNKCLCGCGQIVKLGKRYIWGHNRKNVVLTEKEKRNMRKTAKKRWQNPEYREKNRGHTGYKQSKETKKKISKAMKNKKLSKKHKEKLSKAQKEYFKNNPEELKKFIISGQKNPSNIELKVKKQLKKNNISFIHQYRLNNFFYDFYLPEYNLIIEIDGEYWHNYPNGTKRDKRKNKCAIRNKYNIVRIWGNKIEKDNFNIINYLNKCKNYNIKLGF